MNVAAILLAAGSATRFGSDKLLHALPHDVAIAIQAARHVRAVFDEVFAVTRPEAKELAELLRREGCTVVVCDNAAAGMGASLACAVRAVHAAGPADAYLIALAAGAALAAPYFRSRRGHPVGFAASFRPALEALQGDEGARKIIQADGKDLVKIPVGDPGVIRDIDTPGDLAPPIIV